MRYGHVRAKTRAIAAAAGTALVVVPLSGAAAIALVGQEPTATVPDQLVFAEHSAGLADQVGAVHANSVTASSVAEYSVDTPQITVKANPAPAPRATSTARPVANSGAVKAAIAGSAVIAEASKYVGTPYKAGGSTPAGFDCSGFTSYVYAQFGISLPRSSGAYYNVGTRVSSPQPGDIIVSPGHVGIYAGPNLQIDSPRPGKTIQFRAIWQKNPVYVRVTG